MTLLLAGAAEAVITPPAGVDLTGYANRPSAAVGKHDELYARAVVLEAGEQRLALVSLDLLGLEIAMRMRCERRSSDRRHPRGWRTAELQPHPCRACDDDAAWPGQPGCEL